MAKKKTTAKSGPLDIKGLGTFLKKEANPFGDNLNENDAITTKEYIGSGIHILNAQLSGSVHQGLPDNACLALGGPSSTGKTFLALNFCAQAIRQGYYVIYVDTEGAIRPELAKSFGIDPSMFRVEPMNTLEAFQIYTTKLIQRMEQDRESGGELKLMIVVDSFGGFTTQRQVEDSQSGEIKADVGRKQKQAKELFTLVTHRLKLLRIPMIIVAHTYKSLDMYGGDVWSGGTGLRYFCDAMLRLSKSKPKDTKLETDDMDTSGGQSILITADKNRLAQPKKARIELSFTEGANPYRNLEFFCTKETYPEIGIVNAKVEESVDEDTGEVVTKFTNSNMWYIRHLGKMMHRSQMFTPKVFTPEVLDAIDKVTREYFSYGESAITKFEELNEEMAQEKQDMEDSADSAMSDIFG